LTALSGRYALPLSLLLALALAAATTQRMRPQRVDPCVQPEALRATSLIPGLPAPESALERPDGFLQRIEGTLENPLPPYEAMTFTIVRSFEARHLYLHPTSFVARELEPEHKGLERVETDAGPIHVHYIEDDTASSGFVVAYSFVYALTPVKRPFLAQLRDSISRPLTGPRPPLTLFLVSGEGPRRDTAAVRSRARQWVIDAYEHFAAVCRES
jgi:hypothetical protein